MTDCIQRNRAFCYCCLLLIIILLLMGPMCLNAIVLVLLVHIIIHYLDVIFSNLCTAPYHILIL
jgi:hypothetical protein